MGLTYETIKNMGLVEGTPVEIIHRREGAIPGYYARTKTEENPLWLHIYLSEFARGRRDARPINFDDIVGMSLFRRLPVVDTEAVEDYNDFDVIGQCMPEPEYEDQPTQGEPRSTPYVSDSGVVVMEKD